MSGPEISVRDSEGREKIVATVESSALPTGAATAAAQALALAQLQLIEDLRNVLQSVATDRLIVRGEDQFFSYKQNLGSRTSGVVSGAGGYLDSASPPAGLIWKITNVRSVDITSPTTSHVYMGRWGGVNYSFAEEVAALAAGGNAFYHGEMWLESGQVIRVYFTGSLAADNCEINLTGHVMTLEA